MLLLHGVSGIVGLAVGLLVRGERAVRVVDGIGLAHQFPAGDLGLDARGRGPGILPLNLLVLGFLICRTLLPLDHLFMLWHREQTRLGPSRIASSIVGLQSYIF